MRWKGLKMNWGNNKFSATVSQTLSPKSIKDMIGELHEITGAKEIPMILCNPVNYELVKQQLRNACIDCEIIKSQYVEENMITVIAEPSSIRKIVEFGKIINLFDGD